MGGSSSKKEDAPARGNQANLKEPSTITGSDRVKLQLKVQRDNLIASIRKYERVGDSEHEKAREFMRTGNKRRALYCLKRERMQQDQIKTVTGILDNVQTLIDTVEFALIENEVVSALSDGKAELDRLNKMLDVDDIAKLMDETAESVEMARQIDLVLRQPLSSDVDNDDLLAELEYQMGTEKEPAALDNVNVPSHKLPAHQPTSLQPEVASTRVTEAA